MFIEDIIAACRQVLSSKREALEDLGLDNISYPQPMPHNTSAGSLQVTYSSVLNTVVAARELQFAFVEKQCQLTLDLLKTIAVAKNMDLQHNVDGEDIVGIMLALIDEESHRFAAIQPREEVSSASEDNQEIAPQPPAEATVPTRGDKELETQQQPPAENQPQLAMSPARKTDEQPATSPAADQDRQPTATPPVRPSYATAASKNKRHQCSFCPFFGMHLEQHIAAKHKDAFNSNTEKVALVHKHDKLSKQQHRKNMR